MKGQVNCQNSRASWKAQRGLASWRQPFCTNFGLEFHVIPYNLKCLDARGPRSGRFMLCNPTRSQLKSSPTGVVCLTTTSHRSMQRNKANSGEESSTCEDPHRYIAMHILTGSLSLVRSLIPCFAAKRSRGAEWSDPLVIWPRLLLLLTTGETEALPANSTNVGWR